MSNIHGYSIIVFFWLLYKTDSNIAYLYYLSFYGFNSQFTIIADRSQKQ